MNLTTSFLKRIWSRDLGNSKAGQEVSWGSERFQLNIRVEFPMRARSITKP